MNIIERMLEATSDIFEKYNEHPFVKGIENGTLDKDKFRFYIIQDYLYLEEYAKVFAIGVAKAKSLEMANLFAGYIAVMNGELNVHSGYLSRLEVTEEEILKTPRALDNLSYTSYMLRIAYEDGEAEILAAILSCAYGYELIARKILENNPSSVNDSFYGQWVENYNSKEFSDGNKILLEKMIELSKDYPEEKLSHLVDIFINCSRYELSFWEMSWNKKF